MEQNVNAGHRARLREKLLKVSADALADYELLELLLTYSIPRKDVKPLAKELIKRFGSLGAVIQAKPEKLATIPGIKENTTALFALTAALTAYVLRRDLLEKPILDKVEKIRDYCYALTGRADKELLYVLYLDSKMRLICEELSQKGSITHTTIYPREIIERALELSATGFIICHNHPSGDPRPSKGDVDMTAHLAEVAKPLGLYLHDHLIVSRQGDFSFRQAGYL